MLAKRFVSCKNREGPSIKQTRKKRRVEKTSVLENQNSDITCWATEEKTNFKTKSFQFE